MRVKDIGEFSLIERLARHIPGYGPQVLEGLGDDVAVLRTSPDRLLLLTCDIQVSGVHFLPGAITPFQLGHKIAAINLSDIGAMGGQPLHFLFSLALPPDEKVEDLEALYDGIRGICERFEVDVVGGNISKAPVLMIDAFLVGEVTPDRLLKRQGAEPGDLILVTGSLAGSRAGLELVLRPELRSCVESPVSEACLTRHLTPIPRVREGQTIAELGGAKAMIDVSDGLASDLGHLCEQSLVGARLWADQIPVDPSSPSVAEAAGADPLLWALTGGEDYELCFTADKDRAEILTHEVTAQTGTPVRIIGEILPAAQGRHLRLSNGTDVPLSARGWDHFPVA